MTLSQMFESSARSHSEKPAVFWGEQEIFYRDLLHQSQAVARHLRSWGVQPGDRVALWLKNCPEFIPSYFGILLAGGVVVPVNNFLKPEEVSFITRDSGSVVIITDSQMASGAEEVQRKTGSLKIFFVEQIQEAGLSGEVSEDQAAPAAPSSLAVIIYTSGTTGHPKGAMLTHDNLLSNIQSCREVLKAVEHDRFVLLLPMFHSFMMTVCILLPLSIGGSIILVKSLHPPKAILQEVLMRNGTILPAIPQLFRALANSPLPPQLPTRLCISGAAPLPGEILKEFTEKTGIPLLEGYGLSEASPVVSLNPIQGPWKPGSIGVPIPGVSVSVQNDEGVILPPGELGEICVRGPNVMQGYWNQPEETGRALREGWLLTGDIGYGDEDGYFYITDRKKDMLLVNGINVYPREIEEVLYQFPGVKEAAVVGKADPRKGEQPVAFVSPAEGVQLDEKAMQQFLRERLADYKVPRRFSVLPALPRNATGKILKTSLRQLDV